MAHVEVGGASGLGVGPRVVGLYVRHSLPSAVHVHLQAVASQRDHEMRVALPVEAVKGGRKDLNPVPDRL